MSSTNVDEEDPYKLGCNYVASGWLALFHFLIRARFAYNNDGSDRILRIADVGTGTGIWQGELTRELPSSTQFDGYDISDLQYPSVSWYGPNTTLSKLDIFKPLLEELKEKYDVVHLRFFMTVASDDNVDVVIENLKGMLKPGGYLQWVERDWLSFFPKTVNHADSANAQLTAYMSSKFFPKADWIFSLPSHFTGCGLEPWNEDHLIGTAAIGDMIADAAKRKWFKELRARCATECAKGWFVDWELVAVVGRKKD
ncbi:hypothetical protein JMJ35_010744 [Cladonia borealis]|uniref:Methyltransferase n=1 Tax=Cladonia borealis TaxID=184061 RepID=A0AA39U379_9LECA|nr:hypothetical protein JMJ35_010744 [Cladonia borealis]